MIDVNQHPCFSEHARKLFSRVHLPVAPRCNVSCNYCNRKFDCSNESRPGVTSTLLSPAGAESYLEELCAKDASVRVVGIAGPGDPLANANATFETLRRVRRRYPTMITCLATNGLRLPDFASEIIDVGVSHVTVTVNAVDPEVASKMYAWVMPKKEILRGAEAAATLWAAQSEGIRLLASQGILVKINCVVVPGVNDHHVADVAEATAQLGAKRFNCLPLNPTAHTPFAHVPEPTFDQIAAIRARTEKFLAPMLHCSRCRADAAGKIGDGVDESLVRLLKRHAARDKPADRPCIAVATMEGFMVNEHLGSAEEIWVFAAHASGYHLVEKRTTPPTGLGDERWRRLAQLLSDCRSVLVSGVGETPRRILAHAGIAVVETEGLIEDLVPIALENKPLPASKKLPGCGAGISCNGDGLGCG